MVISTLTISLPMDSARGALTMDWLSVMTLARSIIPERSTLRLSRMLASSHGRMCEMCSTLFLPMREHWPKLHTVMQVPLDTLTLTDGVHNCMSALTGSLMAILRKMITMRTNATAKNACQLTPVVRRLTIGNGQSIAVGTLAPLAS